MDWNLSLGSRNNINVLMYLALLRVKFRLAHCMHLYASAAAPNPLSTFTTPTPGEQLLSIVSMALIPPRETP